MMFLLTASFGEKHAIPVRNARDARVILDMVRKKYGDEFIPLSDSKMRIKLRGPKSGREGWVDIEVVV